MQFRIVCASLVFITSCKLRSASELRADNSQRAFALSFQAQPSQSKNFQGIGVQWDPLDHDVGDYTESEWSLMFKRLQFARPSLMRIGVNPYFYFKEASDRSRNAYVWQNSTDPELKFSVQYEQLRKILGFAKEQNTHVYLSQWSGLSLAAPYESPESQGRLLDLSEQLINVENFDNIKYLSIINEPDGFWTYGDPSSTQPAKYWSRWQTAVGNFSKQLSSRSIAPKVAFSGPSCDLDLDWVARSMKSFGHMMGAYDFHQYSEDSRIISGVIEREHTAMRQKWTQSVPAAEMQKPLLVTEFGRNSGKDPNSDSQSEIHTIGHGVKMADLLVQYMRAGVSGLFVYEVDDRAHFDEEKWQKNPNVKIFKRWGLWSTLPGESQASRPWFYPMGLAMRFFPRGASILHADSVNAAGLRFVAARYGEQAQHVSAILVNNNSAARTITVRVPDYGNVTDLSVYRYSEGTTLFDAAGIPIASARLKGQNLASGVEVALPPNSVVILATEI